MSKTINYNLPTLSNEGGLSAYLEQIKKLVDELLVRETIDGREAREMLDINILTDPYSASMTPSLIKDAPSI